MALTSEPESSLKDKGKVSGFMLLWLKVPPPALSPEPMPFHF
jgi:hypothetical protein